MTALFDPQTADFVVEVDGAAVPVTVLRHPRARRLRLRYDARGGTLKLTMPPRGGMTSARKWVNEQTPWIARQLAVATPRNHIVPGAALPFGDTKLLVDWHEKAARAPHMDGDHLIIGGPEAALPRRIARWLAGEARAALTPATEALAAGAALPLTGVSVGDPRSRWGSCSASGAIRYSWRLMMAPRFVQESVVAHEVAHLAHMDHSPRFHRLAAELLGTDPTPARTWLRRHGAGLHTWDFS